MWTETSAHSSRTPSACWGNDLKDKLSHHKWIVPCGIVIYESPSCKDTDKEERKQPKALVFISETVLLFLCVSHMSLKNNAEETRNPPAPLPSPCQDSVYCSAILHLSLYSLTFPFVLEGMQLESKSSGTEGQQWHSSPTPGEQILVQQDPGRLSPLKDGAEEPRCLLFFHLCSRRSPLLQQRTRECKGKGGRGDASPSLLKLRG